MSTSIPLKSALKRRVEGQGSWDEPVVGSAPTGGRSGKRVTFAPGVLVRSATSSHGSYTRLPCVTVAAPAVAHTTEEPSVPGATAAVREELRRLQQELESERSAVPAVPLAPAPSAPLPTVQLRSKSRSPSPAIFEYHATDKVEKSGGGGVSDPNEIDRAEKGVNRPSNEGESVGKDEPRRPLDSSGKQETKHHGPQDGEAASSDEVQPLKEDASNPVGSECSTDEEGTAAQLRRLDALQVTISGYSKISDMEKTPFYLYNLHVSDGVDEWIVRRRYQQFQQLHEWMEARFPHKPLPPFPQAYTWKLFSPSADTIAMYRRNELERFLRGVLGSRFLLESFEVQFFLEFRRNGGGGGGGHIPSPLRRNVRVLAPLPAVDFDPTEIAVPWKILTLEGYEVVFATPTGEPAEADPLLVRRDQVLYGRLGAEFEAKQFYLEMIAHPRFVRPLRYAAIEPTEYDALVLTGGHAKGMRPYLESDTLQEKVAEFVSLQRPIGAICHGVLLLARCRNSYGDLEHRSRSVLADRHVTTLPTFMETLAHYLVSWRLGDYYRTYESACATEVCAQLAQPLKQYHRGPYSVTRGTMYDHSHAFVVVDGNLVTARWPGDAYLYALTLVRLIKKGSIHAPAGPMVHNRAHSHLESAPVPLASTATATNATAASSLPSSSASASSFTSSNARFLV